jgi:16S rRNA (adenine1518-N6/adenine1519-N6)-dimethyltransferase
LADGLPPIAEVIRRHRLGARRGLGQNFLLDLNLTGRIARAGGPADGTDIVEIGPGPGGLTRALLAEGARRVVAIERDRRCIPALEEIAAAFPGRLRIVEADALRTDIGALATAPARIIANLPYNIATPLLVGWLSARPWPPWWERAVVMFQREVAGRIVAAPGSSAYGRLSVISQWRARCRVLFTVNPRAFTPPPKVTSAVVEITPVAEPADAPSLATLEKVTAAAFGQRRKMLRSSLRAVGGDVESLVRAAGIEPTLRAEQVPVEAYVRMAQFIERG